MTIVHNEQTKLAANALDRASTSCLTVGVFGPIAAMLYSIGWTGLADHGIVLMLASVVWISAAVALHLLARRILRALR